MIQIYGFLLYGAPVGMFMARHDRWKLVAYPGYTSQLNDKQLDPTETRDLGQNPEYTAVLADMTARLNAITDSAATNARALSDQAARIAELGGRDAILARQNYDHSPVNA